MEFPSLTNVVPQLVAPRPLKARRHQKSIISLENFSVANALAANGSSTPNAGGISTTNGSGNLSLYTNYNGGAGNFLNPIETDMGGCFPTSGSGSNNSAGNGNYSDEIPFPSFSSNNNTNNTNNTNNSANSSGEPGTSTNSGNQKASPRYYRSTSSAGQSLYPRPKSLSRKSSLLESWEFQNIRLSGSKIVGDTNVSVLMPTNSDLHIQGNNGGADGASDGSSNSSHSSCIPSFDYASYNNFDEEMQTMPLYSPGNEAVNELFHIMKNTSLLGGAEERSMTPAPIYYTNSSAFYYEPSYSASMPSAGSMASDGGEYDFVPPSPVARSTRNPIIANTEFQENHS